ncbi:hypothetical protein C6N75_09710 [Streptomyces solincola]|uniref:Uncharacterized protein n=1 Tax=Streptomyces solincola TaxID=2100817 RepID=A0A2S9PY53_9ACTN|nr:hypothetical protein [Streptomyces solincola]PRH79351.1 hypothetical protein C6N75_09710 [Streptomyces solincola]
MLGFGVGRGVGRRVVVDGFGRDGGLTVGGFGVARRVAAGGFGVARRLLAVGFGAGRFDGAVLGFGGGVRAGRELADGEGVAGVVRSLSAVGVGVGAELLLDGGGFGGSSSSTASLMKTAPARRVTAAPKAVQAAPEGPLGRALLPTGARSPAVVADDPRGDAGDAP